MKCFIFKKDGLYNALTEDGWLINKYDFRSDRAAHEWIPQKKELKGYDIEFVIRFWEDERLEYARKNYELNYPGALFNGQPA